MGLIKILVCRPQHPYRLVAFVFAGEHPRAGVMKAMERLSLFDFLIALFSGYRGPAADVSATASAPCIRSTAACKVSFRACNSAIRSKTAWIC